MIPFFRSFFPKDEKQKHNNFARPKSHSLTVLNFFQLENVSRDELGEMRVHKCRQWFKSEGIARSKMIKDSRLDERVSLLSAYSFKQFLWELQMMKKKFLDQPLDDFGVLLLDYHLEKDKIYHKHMLELLLYNPDLNALCQYHMKVPTLFLIESISKGLYKGELIPSTGEKWQVFLFLQALVLFIKLLVNEVLLTGDGRQATETMIEFTVWTLCGGALVTSLMAFIFKSFRINTLKSTQGHLGNTINSHFWADRRWLYGLYSSIGLGGLIASLWLTAMVTMSSSLSGSPLLGDVGLSTSIAIIYVLAVVMTYVSKLFLSFAPLKAGSVTGIIYYGTIRLINSSANLLTMLLEWSAMLMLLSAPFLFFGFLASTLQFTIYLLGEKHDEFSPQICRVSVCAVRQGVRLLLFCMIFWLPIELIEYYNLSELCWNAVKITNIGQGQRTVHPNVDLFELVVLFTAFYKSDVKKYKWRRGIQSQLNEMRNKGNVLKLNHLEYFSFLIGGHGDSLETADSSFSVYNQFISDVHSRLQLQSRSTVKEDHITVEPTTNVMSRESNGEGAAGTSSTEQEDIELNNSILKTSNTNAI